MYFRFSDEFSEIRKANALLTDDVLPVGEDAQLGAVFELSEQRHQPQVQASAAERPAVNTTLAPYAPGVEPNGTVNSRRGIQFKQLKAQQFTL